MTALRISGSSDNCDSVADCFLGSLIDDVTPGTRVLVALWQPSDWEQIERTLMRR